MTVSEELMEILVCPDCHGDLEEREPASVSAPPEDLDSVLVCLACGLAYPVRDGIPVMLIEEAFPTEASGGPDDAATAAGPPEEEDRGEGST